MRRHGRYRSPVAAALGVMPPGACASTVEESERDTSGRFDGRWTASVEEGVTSSVRCGNWKKNCTGGDWQVRFVVDDGTVSLPLSDQAEAPSAFIDPNGTFRPVVPRGAREVSSRESGSVGTSSLEAGLRRKARRGGNAQVHGRRLEVRWRRLLVAARRRPGLISPVRQSTIRLVEGPPRVPRPFA